MYSEGCRHILKKKLFMSAFVSNNNSTHVLTNMSIWSHFFTIVVSCLKINVPVIY